MGSPLITVLTVRQANGLRSRPGRGYVPSGYHLIEGKISMPLWHRQSFTLMDQGPALGFRSRTLRALDNPDIRRGVNSPLITVLTVRQANGLRSRPGRGYVPSGYRCVLEGPCKLFQNNIISDVPNVQDCSLDCELVEQSASVRAAAYAASNRKKEKNGTVSHPMSRASRSVP